MKKLGLTLSLVFIIVMAILPFYSLKESISLGKLPKEQKRIHWQTNNSTRIPALSWQELQNQIVEINYPVGEAADFVVLANASSWQQAFCALGLLAYPAKGALILTDKPGINKMEELIKQLNPQGMNLFEGAQVVLLGELVEFKDQLEKRSLKVLSVPGDDAKVAKSIVDLSSKINGSREEAIIVDQSDSVNYALPAATWIAHRGTPVFFINGKKIPEETQKGLQRGFSHLYLMKPQGSTGADTLSELSKYGKVQEIAEEDPVLNAIKFARFYDEANGFGWRATQATVDGGKHFLLTNTKDWHWALSGAQLFAHGVFGPLLISEEDKVPAALEKFYFSVSPNWWVTPAEGPYNHSWILGNQAEISYPVQGRLNFLSEISNYQSLGDQGISGLEALTIVWFALAICGAIWTWFHLNTRMFQLSPFMKLAWVLVVLSLGPVGLWAYYTAYKGYVHQVAKGEFLRPLWVQVLASTCSTMGFGIPAMVGTAFLLTFFGLPLVLNRGELFVLTGPMAQTVIWPYLAALLSNAFIFVPLMLAFKENSNYWDTVRANWLTVFISMTAISIGMMASMWWLMMEYLDMMPEEENLLWWGSMYAANIIGLITGYVGNWLLVIRGEKKGTM